MINNNQIQLLPFARGRELSTLVENKRAFTLDSLELHVYETYKVSEQVPLRFDDIVMINMIQGKKVMHINNIDSFEYLPGEMIVLPASVGMNIDFPEATFGNPTQCTALTVSRERIGKVMDYLNEFYPKVSLSGAWKLDDDQYHLYNTPELADLLDKLFQIMISTNPLKNALADLTFKELMIRLLQTQSLLTLELGNASNTTLDHLKEFVHRHITEKLTLDTLEKVANMSKSSIARMFKQELGVSPMEYVIRQRLVKAKELLMSARSVKEACFGAGFNDVNYFVRLFKSREGITPGAFMLT
ncbi:AraC family transcriptional regulator [Sphingobacterium faecale]|uniref:AraC family transcriptional regulator n=1 Tax=Sphingobacterium faecale TaxID=2803775 RepID=A0ABS1R780_9SPHI|nr:AraC family transcriptional regulator [Sphingobacterium faecale]MBL1410569.1 AraC family transcriptional regulator [Sphingobacterium faecale]